MDSGAANSERADSVPSRRSTVLAIAVAALVTLALGAVVSRQAPGLVAAQRVRPATFPPLLEANGLRTGVLVDCAFAMAYVALGLLILSLFRRARPLNPRAWHPTAAAGALMLVAAGAADLVENLLLYGALHGDRPGALRTWLSGMRAAGVVKWSLLAAALVAFLLVLATRSRSFTPGDSRDRPGTASGGSHPWDPPVIDADGKGPHRLGVCLSGGGIRSAAFALGGIQALQDKGIMANAEYLAAASGGGYLAAGWAVSDANTSAVTSTGPWSRGSPEERWFRNNSSYLVPDLLGGLKGVSRLIGGVVVNFLIVWLLLFLVARPVGWAIEAVHPELAPVEPVALARDSTGALRIDRVEPDGAVDSVVDGATVRANRYAVFLGSDLEARANQVCFDTKPFTPGEREHCFSVLQLPDRPAIVEVRAGKAEVVAQPKAWIAFTDGFGNSVGVAVRQHLEIVHHPEVTLKTAAVQEPVRPDQLTISRQVEVRSNSGLVGRPDPRYRSWMWQGSLGLLAGALVVALWVVGWRRSDGRELVGRDTAIALALAGVTCLLVTIGLPALATWLPDLATKIPGTDLPIGDPLLPSGGLVLAILAAARQYLTANKKGAGTGPAEQGGSSLLAKVRARLRGSTEQLSWYETSPTKIILLVVLVLGFIVSFVSQLQYSIANGATGRLMGVSLVRDKLPYWAFLPEYCKFAIVAALLLAFAATFDAHSWSLYPFYKRRLSRAYMLRRSGGRVLPIPFSEFLPFTDEGGRWAGLRQAGEAPRRGAKLVLCCSVNLSEVGVVPPGRRAASFTFDSDYIGGPLVGYIPAEEYWANLPDSRRRDITIPSAMAISGAAFSPAMGKTNLGPVGSVLALANLRLGVWLPHPQSVTAANANRWNGLRRPGWPWYLLEVFNRYRFQRRYVYVSDGGHWDNLGLVELLRRGCTQIICISAAGDGARSFGTLAEAIALAREELGVEITLDPSPLRPPVRELETPPARELRRRGGLDTAAPFAPASFQVGHYTWQSSTSAGTILYIETALTADLPFDVHGFAESETIFPDDSTADQVFNHRQFEAFRALGYHQVFSALKSAVEPVDSASS